MTTASKTTIKTYFTTGATPSQQNFTDLIDSFLGLGETASQTIPSAIIVSGAASLVGNVTVSGNIAMYGTATLGVAAQTSWQSALGLGTAALLNVGTGANQIVQMTAASKLPAVDGSLLTNIGGTLTQIGATQTASNSASVAFTSGINSTYNHYIIEISDIVAASDNVNFEAQIFQSGAYLTTGYFSGAFYTSESAASGSAQQSNTAFLGLSIPANQMSTNVNQGPTFIIDFFNPSVSALHPAISWRGGGEFNNQGSTYIIGSGRNTTAGAWTGIKFLMSAGNITSGTFKLYGVS